MANTVGYLTAFDGVTLLNHSTLKATNNVSNTSTVLLRTHVLPSGFKVYYPAAADSPVTPGKATQDIYCVSGGEALYGALTPKLGHIGTLTLTKLATGTLTCSAVLEAVDNITQRSIHGTGYMQIRVTFELISEWE